MTANVTFIFCESEKLPIHVRQLHKVVEIKLSDCRQSIREIAETTHVSRATVCGLWRLIPIEIYNNPFDCKTMNTETMESAYMKQKRSIAKNSKCFALNVVIFMLAVTIVRQFLVFERSSYAFSVKIRNNGSMNADVQRLDLLQMNSSLKVENDRLAGELSILRGRIQDATKCFPSGTSDQLEVGASHVACLEEALELGKKEVVLIPSNDSAATLEKCSEERRKEIGALKREMDILGDRLRRSVEFLPLKDQNMASSVENDRTWFMSTVREKSEDGNPEHSFFPSEGSNGKILCLKGRNNRNGSLNSYAFAWPNYLPPNSSLVGGLTFIADSFYDYGNPWHSMNSLVVSASWRMKKQCEVPQRFILYHNGELVTSMGSYITSLLLATLDRNVPVLEDLSDEPVCFEKAVVYRRAFGGMSVERKIEMFDMVRCKARKFCGIPKSQRIVDGIRTINVTLIARTGARSFKNESLVASVIERECNKVPGCRFRLVRIVNMSFCEQVEAMSRTDILATAHGAQLTNMMFMEKGSSVMEMFPKGWLEGAGVGQYIYHWFADWTGMKHEGTYRDSQGPECPNPQEGRIPCFIFHKDRQVGHNETFLAQWTAQTLLKFQNRTSSEAPKQSSCPCK